MARASRLTETAIKAIRLEPHRKQEIHWDSVVTGLGVRVLRGGSKTFWYQYKDRMVRIGSWPEVSLADARAAAKGYAGAVARGEDPAAEKQEERRRSAATLGSCSPKTVNTRKASSAAASSMSNRS